MSNSNFDTRDLNGQAPPSSQDYTNARANSFRQTQQLLGAYPIASATPSTHVARHLSSLTIAAATPSYIQPSGYMTPGNYGNSPVYYSEMSRLASSNVPQQPDERMFWETSRNNAIRLLGDQGVSSYYAPLPSYWNPAPAPSSYQLPSFAQSVVQHTTPYNVYPTPPPPQPFTFSASSSSLANALGTFNEKHEDRVESASMPHHPQYHPDESGAFFNKFLDEKAKKISDISVHRSAETLNSSPTSAVSQSSPDPLRIGNLTSSPLTPLTTSQTTPKKRRLVEVVIDSPSKRPPLTPSDLASPLSVSQTTGSPVQKANALKANMSPIPRTPKKQLYVEITTPKGGSTPLSKQLPRFVESSDLGGYGSEDDNDYTRQREISINGVRSVGRKTGDRDDRGPLEKFQNLLDDLFEAEDNLSFDSDVASLPALFSQRSTDSSRPLVSPQYVIKLTKAISKVSRPTKRLRLASIPWESNAPGTPRRTGGISEVETQILSRVLKLLERSVRAGEDLDPFSRATVNKSGHVNEAVSNATSPMKVGKSKVGKKKAAVHEEEERISSSPSKIEEADPKMDIDEASLEITEEDVLKLEHCLETARDSVLAANCCISLLTSDRLPKQLYSEELITSCLTAIRNQLTKIIYAFTEASASDTRDSSPLLKCITSSPGAKEKNAKVDLTELRTLIGEIFQVITAVLPGINNLVCADIMTMSDTIVIQAVYIAIGPFFVIESGGDSDKIKKTTSGQLVSSTLGSSGMRGLRLEALSLVRSIFANYEDQRSWIIEEILSSLIKLSDSKQRAGQFRLRDGRSIRTVSALLLQLVQTSAHNIRLETRRIAKARQQQFAMKRQDSSAGESPDCFLDDKDLEEIRLYSNGLEAPTKAAKAIVVFLTQRSGKGKSTKNSNEQEYRTIFDNLISDLLTVLFWPEWPAASLVLSIICKYMISSLDDVKSSNDNNASKSLALDHLGVIAGRLRANMIKCGRLMTERTLETDGRVKTMDEVLAMGDEQQLERLVNIHQEVSSHLSKRSSEDQAFDSARELSAVMWGQELTGALEQLNSVLVSNGDVSPPNMFYFGTKIKAAIRDIWRNAPTDVFDNATQEEIARIDRLSEMIGTTQALKNAFDPILNVIIVALDAPPVFVRTKALRALSQILTVDSAVLSNPSVRHAIESHLLDSSPQVRDAAVELIGKYMIDSPIVAGDYYHKIAERIADTGLGVRKRVIKLLKSYYLIADDLDKKVDICVKLVLRMLDEDDTVKDLAIKTLEELWFSPPSFPIPKLHGQNDSGPATEKNLLLAKVSVVMGVCGNFKDRLSPLEDMLSKIVSTKEGADVSALHVRYAELCDVMIDGLVDASDFMNFSVINCIRTIHLFTAAFPSIISGSKASTLLPYLKNPTTTEEHITSDYILKIYRASIPHMPKTSLKFGNDLQLLLQPMVLKPNAQAGLGALQETVACLCTVVQHLTHDYVRLIALLKSCNLRVQDFLNRTTPQLNPQDSRTLHILVLIVSLLGEHFDFDQLRIDSADFANSINAINKGPIIKHIYQCILRLYEKYENSNIRGRLLQCLGFLFRAQPTLMTLESSATMMDAIFASSEEDNRGRLLKLMQEFLIAESSKHSAQEKESAKSKTSGVNCGVNMEELVGNTHGFAESGVSSAVVQRYLVQIHDAALSQIPQVQNSAVDILSYTVKQGLAHPLLSFPVIVALETSPVNSLSSRAIALHVILHNKHASLLNSGYIVACRKSYEYQCKFYRNLHTGDDDFSMVQSQIVGYRMQPTPNALLSRWYALVREKRTMRQEFLRAVLKTFEIRDMSSTSQDDVNFTRYMAENFSSFDYRTQEEVLTVIKILTRELAETGALLVERIAPGNLLAQLKPSQKLESIDQHGQIAYMVEMPPELFTEQSSNTNSVDKREFSSLSLDGQLTLLKSSCIVGMIMLLKAHLKNIYGISEDKCQKFVLGKKSAVGDRPAIRKKDTAISWERIPFATKLMLTSEDAEEQKARFLEVWNEDGATTEQADVEWE